MSLWKYDNDIEYTVRVIEMNHTRQTVSFKWIIPTRDSDIYRINLDRFLRVFTKLSPVEALLVDLEDEGD